MERVVVTMSAELLRDVDELACRLGKKRSQLVRMALEEILERPPRTPEEDAELGAVMEEGYKERYKELAKTAEEWLPLTAKALEKSWHWDD